MSPAETQYAGRRMLVVGLGATGLSVLRYLLREGADVVVTDSRTDPAGAELLADALGSVEMYLGGFDAPRPLSRFDEAVISPGVPLDEPFVQELADTGVPLIGDIELFARAVDRDTSVVGITGSNGKSTVTTLLADMARAAGIRVAVGGNLGPPALDLLEQRASLYVLELSSFQLETTYTLKCQAAAYLNLSEDHLDRHGDMARYGAIKSRIFRNADVAVCNSDDPKTLLCSDQAARRVTFSVLDADADFHLHSVDGEARLMARDAVLCTGAELALRGTHNLSNALAALALAEAVDVERATALTALKAFRGLPHRCEVVAEQNGVSWLNDSKGTNVGSTVAALQGLAGPILWLGGGQGKGQDFSPLRAPLADKGRAAFLFGCDAPVIRSALLGVLPIHVRDTLVDALDAAAAMAEPGDTVLLSPACASLDQFSNYIERGNTFRHWVEQRCAS